MIKNWWMSNAPGWFLLGGFTCAVIQTVVIFLSYVCAR